MAEANMTERAKAFADAQMGGSDSDKTERVPWGHDENPQDISIGVSTTFTFTCRRRYFKPENLVVDASATNTLLVTDIKIGTKSMLGSSLGIAARLFANNSLIGHLSWPELGINETVKVTVQVPAGAAASITAVMLGLIGQASKE